MDRGRRQEKTGAIYQKRQTQGRPPRKGPFFLFFFSSSCPFFQSKHAAASQCLSKQKQQRRPSVVAVPKVPSGIALAWPSPSAAASSAAVVALEKLFPGTAARQEQNGGKGGHHTPKIGLMTLRASGRWLALVAPSSVSLRCCLPPRQPSPTPPRLYLTPIAQKR